MNERKAGILSGIKGVIFDLDGVLLDSMSIWKDLGARYLQSQGIAPEEGFTKTGDVYLIRLTELIR